MKIRNMLIGMVVLLVLGVGFFAFGGMNLVAPQPTPAPVSAASELDNLVAASGTLLPARRANLAFKLAGPVTQVAVQVGDVVKKNDPLIKLDAVELDAAIAQAQAAVALAQANLAELQSGASKEDIAIAQANVETAKAQLAKVRAGASAEDVAQAQASLDRATSTLKNAQADYDQIKHDPAAGMYPQSIAYQAASEQYRIAQAQYLKVTKGASADDLRIAETAVNAAQANLDRVRAKARSEVIAAAQARLAQAQGALTQARASRASATLTAPFAGTVAAINVKVGEQVSPGVPVITLGDLTSLRLETDDLSETSIARVKIGQAVAVTFEALPDRSFQGKVTQIAPMASARQGGTNYTTTIEFANLDTVLRWGMTGRVEINTKQ